MLNFSSKDLNEISRILNIHYFDNKLKFKISWDKRELKSRWGLCKTSKKIITINPILKNSSPEVISTIVYHEMLHLVFPSYKKNGRWVIHSPEFKRREKQYPFYQKTNDWIKAYHQNEVQETEELSPQSHRGYFVGQEITVGSTSYKITGFRPHKPKCSILAERISDNKKFRISIEDVENSGPVSFQSFHIGQLVKVPNIGPRLSKMSWKIVAFKPHSKHPIRAVNERGTHYKFKTKQVKAS